MTQRPSLPPEVREGVTAALRLTRQYLDNPAEVAADPLLEISWPMVISLVQLVVTSQCTMAERDGLTDGREIEAVRRWLDGELEAAEIGAALDAAADELTGPRGPEGHAAAPGME